MVVTYGVYFDTRISRVWCNYTIRGLEESINGIILLNTNPHFCFGKEAKTPGAASLHRHVSDKDNGRCGAPFSRSISIHLVN